MPLLQLPPEILLHIFNYLGSQYFAHDTHRLTISRGWYRLAWTAFLRDLHLTAQSLEKFTQNELILERCSPYMVSVGINLPLRTEREPCQPLLADGSIDTSRRDRREVDDPRLQLDSSLAKFAAILPQCPGIRSLNIQARGQSCLGHVDSMSSMNALRLTTLLSPPHLISLDLDTAACHLESPPNSNVHVCNVINALLPSLRRLRCRMEEICDGILQYASAGSATLEEVIVNLSLSQYRDDITSYRLPNRCGATMRNFLSLRSALETQATALAARLSNPRMVRIISHELPSLEIYTFDAITETRLKLENNLQWDADGELVDEGSETETESDLFADDSPIEPVEW